MKTRIVVRYKETVRKLAEEQFEEDMELQKQHGYTLESWYPLMADRSIGIIAVYVISNE